MTRFIAQFICEGGEDRHDAPFFVHTGTREGDEPRGVIESTASTTVSAFERKAPLLRRRDEANFVGKAFAQGF